MGNNQSVTDDLKKEARLEQKKHRDKEAEWKKFLQKTKSENMRLKEELKTEFDKRGKIDEHREQLRRQEEAEYRKNLEQIRIDAKQKDEQIRSLEAKQQKEKSVMQEERAIELQKIQKARLDNDKEKELKHNKKLTEISKRADQQIKSAKAARYTAEQERIQIEEDRIKRTEEEEERKKRGKEERLIDMRKEIKSLKPGDSFEFPPDNLTFPEKYNIGLFGTTGIGKSSLLNSLKFAFKGELNELTREQTSTDQFHGGNTVRRLEVQITRHLTFIDNRGVGAEDLENINAGEEIISQLEGRAGFAKQVDWRSSDGAKGRKARAKHKIHCTILVFDAQNPQAVYSVLPKLVDQIHTWQGRFPIGVLTHVDEATPEQLENMYVVTKAGGIVDTYEVANITDKRTELGKDHQLALLKLMRLCIKQGDEIFKLRDEIAKEEADEREIAEENARKLKQDEKEMMAMTRERERNAREEENARKMRDNEKAKIEMEAERERSEVEKVKMMQEVEDRTMVMKTGMEKAEREEEKALMRREIEEATKAEIEKEKLKMIREMEEAKKVKEDERNTAMVREAKESKNRDATEVEETREAKQESENKENRVKRVKNLVKQFEH